MRKKGFRPDGGGLFCAAKLFQPRNIFSVTSVCGIVISFPGSRKRLFFAKNFFRPFCEKQVIFLCKLLENHAFSPISAVFTNFSNKGLFFSQT
ncbi:hypothetical protein [Ruminococcus sp.]|uniref:hypothetical protein n=1 Tax=Ruminococcus sp. TaxID=41978 RepID=UPI0025F22C9E|nr:hypothetical protein [Ruminococcus sp.]